MKNIRTKRIKKKLDHRWLGPFKIARKTKGNQAYELELPKSYLIYPTFHVSLLEPYRRRDGAEPPPPSEIDGELEWNVEDILDQRWRHKTREFLVRWEGYSQAHDSWEPEEHLRPGCDTAIETFLRTNNKGSAVVPDMPQTRRRGRPRKSKP